MVKRLKKFIFKFYVLILMAFTVWYGYFMFPLIFGFEGKEQAAESMKAKSEAGSEEEATFLRLLDEQTKTSKTDLGYKVIEQPYIEGRFHHIGFTIQPDNASTCVRCHGNVPHDESKQFRSFLNMHTYYLACETCHAVPEKDAQKWAFRWYDKDNGKITANPPALAAIEDIFFSEQKTQTFPVYGNYGAKVAPTTVNDQGVIRLLQGEKEMEFAERYITEQERLKPEQKSQMQKVMHRKVSEDTIECQQCHQKEDPYLPFAEIGYPPTRLRELTNLPVLGMIEEYKDFYIPSMTESDSSTE